MQQAVIEPMGPPGLKEWLHGLSSLAPMPALLILVLLAALGLWLFLRAMPYRRKAQQALRGIRDEMPDDTDEGGKDTTGAPEPWSDSSEHAMHRWRTVLVLKLHFWLRAGPAILCVLFGLWIFKQALTSYPNPSAFIGALIAHPWQAR